MAETRSLFHLLSPKQTAAPAVCSRGLWAFAFPAESPVALGFLSLVLSPLQLPTISPPPTLGSGSFGEPKHQPQALSGRRLHPGVFPGPDHAGFPFAPQDSRSVSDGSKPRRSAAPSSVHRENCILRAVLGTLCHWGCFVTVDSSAQQD